MKPNFLSGLLPASLSWTTSNLFAFKKGFRKIKKCPNTFYASETLSRGEQGYGADRCLDDKPNTAPIVHSGDNQRSAVLIVPGFGGWSGLYSDMATALRSQGHPEVTVVPVSTHEWLPNVFAGQSFAWYLSRVLTQLDRLFERHGLVSLVAHSQGGVLALILLGSQPYDGVIYNGATKAELLVTLGTGFTSAEKYPFKFLFSLKEQRSNEVPLPPDLPSQEAHLIRTNSLAFTNYYYRDATQLPGTRITCVAGCCQGSHLKGWGVEQMRDWIYAVYSAVSYKVSLRQSGAVGDGVAPTCLAILPGAAGVIILPDVRHMNIFPFYGLPWYGSPEVVAAWDKVLR